MSQPLSVDDMNDSKYALSVTSRATDDTTPLVLEELTYKTIKAWLWIVESYLEKGNYILPPGLTSVEVRYVEEITKTSEQGKLEPFKFQETFGDARVTVWATFRGNSKTKFHLNSDDVPQVAVDTWLANHRAVERVFKERNQTVPQPAQDAQQQVSAQERPATPKNAPQAPVAPKTAGNIPVLPKKEAVAKLNAGDKFQMNIVQIEKHSKDGKDFYDFYEPYGGKAGQYSSVTVYTDNEPAVNSGLIAYLDTLDVKMGQALTGNWTLNCSVGKPKTKVVKGEEKTFTNIYVNSFVGQPVTE